jgi:GntR family transcriptional regulator, transcriptional repressor for pyruvate dehydrogenase complex
LTYQFKSATDKKQVHEKIVDQIKQAIFKNKLPPGEKLQNERELAEMFNTSRVTVRSAILTLKNSGLLYVKKGSGGGTFVQENINETKLSELLHDIIQWKNISIEHVIDVRGIIEPNIAYFAAKNRTDSDMKKIWESIADLEHSFNQKKTFQSNDEHFHKALADAAHNPLLSIFQASLIDLLFKFIASIKWREEEKTNISEYHRKIADKIEAQDPSGARRIMVEHLVDMRQILSRYPLTDVLK